MSGIYSSVACNLDAGILAACYPLFEEEKIEGIEWSFDTLFKKEHVPSWFYELLNVYSQEHRLVGHGVFFSLFSGQWSTQQQQWLDNLRQLSAQFHFDHISEHFGFLTGRDFHSGAPLNIPYTTTTLNIGRDRLARIYDACHCPVGLENLAFAYSAEEVKKHGDFLEQLIEPINGFIILDLHNLYCQSHNFSIDAKTLLQHYPLHRVREIHISGGSWDDSFEATGRVIRRDTHDNAVPLEVFQLLEQTIALCPQLKYVVMEQLGTALKTETSRKQFYNDFISMQQIVEQTTSEITTNQPINQFLPDTPVAPAPNPIIDETLYAQQMELSDILENACSLQDAQNLLATSSLANSAWHIEQWDACMLETARKIAGKWKHGFSV